MLYKQNRFAFATKVSGSDRLGCVGARCSASHNNLACLVALEIKYETKCVVLGYVTIYLFPSEVRDL